MRYLASIVFLMITASVSAIVWWRLWIYDGWPGTLGILHQFIEVDGESSYDLELLEMFLVSLVLYVMLGTLWRHYRIRILRRGSS